MTTAASENAAMAGKVAISAGVVTWSTILGQPIEIWILWLTLILSLFWVWGQVKVHVVEPLKGWRQRNANKRRRATDK